MSVLEDKTERASRANKVIEAIAGCGRGFFAHTDRVSRFEVDAKGRVWFVDAYSQKRIYTHYRYRWAGFSNGGTLRTLVEQMRDFIRTGEIPALNLGPWPEWVCGGDLWGYGDSMEVVRKAAATHGLVAS